MRLTHLTLAAILLARSFKKIELPKQIGEVIFSPDKEPVHEYLDLPDDLPPVFLYCGCYYIDGVELALPAETPEIFRKLASSKAWFSKARKYLSAEEWVYVIIAENPVAALAMKLRTLELKYSILKVKY